MIESHWAIEIMLSSGRSRENNKTIAIIQVRMVVAWTRVGVIRVVKIRKIRDIF